MKSIGARTVSPHIYSWGEWLKVDPTMAQVQGHLPEDLGPWIDPMVSPGDLMMWLKRYRPEDWEVLGLRTHHLREHGIGRGVRGFDKEWDRVFFRTH